MLTFLHLSDLHFTTSGSGSQFDLDLKIRRALLNDLGSNGRTNFDAILVTGDIAYHGHAEEFARAKEWLEEVRTKTDSTPEALFVVPGNHDVNQAEVPKKSSLWDLHQSLRKSMPEQERLDSLEAKLRDPFDFLTALMAYRNFAAEYGCPSTPHELAWVQVLDTNKKLEDGTSVRFHGLNSALLSDEEDKKGNLMLSDFQFRHFDSQPNYVNIVMCHHPHPWLMDGNKGNDFFREQAHVVLCGHDHDPRCYREGKSLRVFAGAVHPNRREQRWEPCYHVLRISVNKTNNKGENRELKVSVETRAWRENDKKFLPYVQSNGSNFHEERIELPPWENFESRHPSEADSKLREISLPSSSGLPVTKTSTDDAFAAARRKLIIHFFRLGTIARYQVVISAGVWEDSDDAFDGQARWARVFDRAERTKKLDALWKAVADKDETLPKEPNPFTTNE
ncbi:MAG: metallophosphoesterase [Nitrospirales bacterium]|nr:metallophosphoesterase [Nitrospirales bacterium]